MVSTNLKPASRNGLDWGSIPHGSTVEKQCGKHWRTIPRKTTEKSALVWQVAISIAQKRENTENHAHNHQFASPANS